MGLRFRFATAIFSLSLLVMDAGAQEWTRFRGPNGSGIGQAPNFPQELSEKDFNWKIKLPGRGHSSPVIWGDRIFVTCNPAGTGKHVLVCVDAGSGQVAWERTYESQLFRQHSDNSYASSTPAVDAERVYLTWMSPEGSGLVALDQTDGREVWRKDLGPFVSEHGPGASPCVFEDSVLLVFDPDAPKSFVVAVDGRTGNERWRWEHRGLKSTASTPVIFTPKHGGPYAITTSYTLGITAFDVRTGAVAWWLSGLLPKRCVASPIITDGGLIVAQCGGAASESFVLAVRPSADGKFAEKLYEVIRTGGCVPTPLALGELLFLWKENGVVTCLRAETNEQIWSERVQGPFYSSPIAVNGRLYNLTVRGELVVISAGEKFREIARLPLGEGSFASPAVSGGRMYLRTFTQLISAGK